MVKKSVLLMSVFACGVILGSGAEAVKEKPPIPGQSKLFECEGWPTTTRRQIKETAEREEKQRKEEEDERQRFKEIKQLNTQRWSNYLMKVSM